MNFLGRSPRLNLMLLGLVAVTFVGLVLLGNWQLRRLEWKLALIERVESRVNAAPVAAPPRAEWPGIDAAGHEYLRVHLRGRFLHEHETLVQALTERGGGYWVLTPLMTPGGETVLINRGFMPAGARAQDGRAHAPPRGEQEVTGLLRMSEPDGIPMRANDPASGRWYSRDVAAIARARGLTDVAPYFVDADATPNPGGLPVGGMTRLNFRNAHLAYALTWYALALLLVAMTVYAVRHERAERRRKTGEQEPLNQA